MSYKLNKLNHMDNFDLKKYLAEGMINRFFTSKDKLLQKEFTQKEWDEDWNPFLYDGDMIFDTKPGMDIADDAYLSLKRQKVLDDLLRKYYKSGQINYDTYSDYTQYEDIHPALYFTYDELVQWAKRGFKHQTEYPTRSECLMFGRGCPVGKEWYNK
tara:strand:- start:135 stop:605 length:471 start_codon:yes stop_codon:yes gene_type:complete